MNKTSDIIHNTSALPKLSYIVPIYNVEKYLRKCVDSLLEQNYSDYEIILINDGSTDNSGAICDEYARMFDNIRVIHQENAGLSAARNAGLALAQGEYICFVDSDDYWQPNVLGGLMVQIERDNLDVLRFRFQNVNEQGEKVHPYKSDPANDNDYSEIPTDGVSFLNSRMNTQCYAVMFILRRDLIIGDHKLQITNDKCKKDNILFTPGIYFEDTDWTPRMLCRAKCVASTDTIVYNYFVRQGSISRAVSREKQRKVLDDLVRLISAMQRQSSDIIKVGHYNIWYRRMIAAIVIGIVELLSNEFYKERKEYLEKLKEMKIFPIHDSSFKTRLINMSPLLTIELMHLKNH